MLYQIYHWLASIPPKISWRKKKLITDAQKDEIASLLAKGYYIILTGERGHLSSDMVRFLSWFTLGKKTKYSHALMNCDYVEKADQRDDFKFVEATAVGVHASTFDEVFHCDYVCLLSPKNITNDEWTKIIDALVKEKGTPYDDLFDLSNSNRISCVESVLLALRANPEYSTDCLELEEMIKKEGNLVPQMYRDCSDFTVIYEA